MKLFLPLLFTSLLAANAQGATAACAQLRQELQSMKKAQQTIMASLVNNHESFASTLEEYSFTVKEKPRSQQQISQQMDNSAEAFRRRGIQGKKMAAQLNTATADLIARVAECLK